MLWSLRPYNSQAKMLLLFGKNLKRNIAETFIPIIIKDNFPYSNDLVSNCNGFLLCSNTARYNGTDVVSTVNSDPKL